MYKLLSVRPGTGMNLFFKDVIAQNQIPQIFRLSQQIHKTELSFSYSTVSYSFKFLDLLF